MSFNDDDTDHKDLNQAHGQAPAVTFQTVLHLPDNQWTNLNVGYSWLPRNAVPSPEPTPVPYGGTVTKTMILRKLLPPQRVDFSDLEACEDFNLFVSQQANDKIYISVPSDMKSCWCEAALHPLMNSPCYAGGQSTVNMPPRSIAVLCKADNPATGRKEWLLIDTSHVGLDGYAQQNEDFEAFRRKIRPKNHSLNSSAWRRAHLFPKIRAEIQSVSAQDRDTSPEATTDTPTSSTPDEEPPQTVESDQWPAPSDCHQWSRRTSDAEVSRFSTIGWAFEHVLPPEDYGDDPTTNESFDRWRRSRLRYRTYLRIPPDTKGCICEYVTSLGATVRICGLRLKSGKTAVFVDPAAETVEERKDDEIEAHQAEPRPSNGTVQCLMHSLYALTQREQIEQKEDFESFFLSSPRPARNMTQHGEERPHPYRAWMGSTPTDWTSTFPRS